MFKRNIMETDSPLPEKKPVVTKRTLRACVPRPISPPRSESQVVFFDHETPPPLILARPHWAPEPELFASPVVVPQDAHSGSRSHVSATPSSQLDATSPTPKQPCLGVPQWTGVWTVEKWKKEHL